MLYSWHPAFLWALWALQRGPLFSLRSLQSSSLHRWSSAWALWSPWGSSARSPRVPASRSSGFRQAHSFSFIQLHTSQSVLWALWNTCALSLITTHSCFISTTPFQQCPSSVCRCSFSFHLWCFLTSTYTLAYVLADRSWVSSLFRFQSFGLWAFSLLAQASNARIVDGRFLLWVCLVPVLQSFLHFSEQSFWLLSNNCARIDSLGDRYRSVLCSY